MELRANLCPQCGAPVLPDAASCAYCGVPFVPRSTQTGEKPAANVVSMPVKRPPDLPPVPDDWARYANPWAGFAIAHPQGWSVICMQGQISVREDPAGYCSANIQPIRLQAPVSAVQAAQMWIGAVRQYYPDFQVWQIPADEKEADKISLRVELNHTGRKLVGSYMISVHGQDALITGFHAPAEQVGSRQRDLEWILSSFRPIEQMPRQMTQEPMEGAFSAWIPQGWQAQAGLNRNHIGGMALPNFTAFKDAQKLTAAVLAWFAWTFQEGMGSFFGFGSPMQSLNYMPAAQLSQNFMAPWMQSFQQQFHLEAVHDRPDLVPLYAAEIAKTGINPHTVDLSVAVMVTTYTEQGVRLRQKSRIVVNHPRMSMGFMMGTPWNAYLDIYYRAPEHEFTAMEPILEGILDSIKTNLAWQQGELMRSQGYIRNAQQDIFRRQQQISQTLSESSDILNQGYWERQGVYDKLSHRWSNAILGYQDMSDGTGTIFNVPSGYDQYWRDGLDQIYGGNLLSKPDPMWIRLEPTGD